MLCSRELQDAIHAAGAVLMFLPPYCPQLNPIETAFSLLRGWLAKYGHELYRKHARDVMDAALECCTHVDNVGRKTFAHSGYHASEFIMPGQTSLLQDNLVITFSDEEEEDSCDQEVFCLGEDDSMNSD